MLRCAMLRHMSAEVCVLKVDLKPCDAILRHAMPRQAMLCHAMLCHAMTSCHAMPCYAMSCHVMLCYAMPCHAMPCHAMPRYATLRYAMLCCAVLCHAVLCCAMLCYAMLCYAMLCYAMLCYPSSQICIPEVDLEPVREELLVAVGAGHLVRQAVLAELILDDAVGGQHNVSLLQFVNACLPLGAMIHNHLQEQSKTAKCLSHS